MRSAGDMVSAKEEKPATSEKNIVTLRVSPPREGGLLDDIIFSMTAGARYKAKLLRKNRRSLSVTASRNPMVTNSASKPANSVSKSGKTSVCWNATTAPAVQIAASTTKDTTAPIGGSASAAKAGMVANAAAMAPLW